MPVNDSVLCNFGVAYQGNGVTKQRFRRRDNSTHCFRLTELGDAIALFLKSFEEFPPAQKAGSFTVGDAFKQLEAVPHRQ